MITVEDALAHIFALCEEVGVEAVPLAEAAGRVLAEPVTARRDQPPFRAAVMDGYAVRGAEVAVGARFRMIGEAPAGRAFSGSVGPGEAVRIFTGAPMPAGADHVVIQEDVARDGDRIVLTDALDLKPNVREIGADFRAGDRVEAPRRLGPADLALIAAMNVPRVTVRRRPVVAILPTGDELVMPGDEPRADQIVASNAFALKAMVEAEGAAARMLPIAGDTSEALAAAFRLAEGADLLLTIGGASVGDYDLVGRAAEAEGVSRAFYKVAMRPGKPLMAGRAGRMVMIGLPGNPCFGNRLRNDLRVAGAPGDAWAWPRPRAAAARAARRAAGGERAAGALHAGSAGRGRADRDGQPGFLAPRHPRAVERADRPARGRPCPCSGGDGGVSPAQPKRLTQKGNMGRTNGNGP
jgi:molybdopterin molybdotransferase